MFPCLEKKVEDNKNGFLVKRAKQDVPISNLVAVRLVQTLLTVLGKVFL